MDERAVSPVVGVVLLIAIALLLTSTVAVAITQFATLDDEADRADDLLDGTATRTTAPDPGTTTGPTTDGPTTTSETTTTGGDDAILVSEADPGEATAADDNVNNLEITVQNTHDESVTVEAFAIDATDIQTGIELDDNNDPEVEMADKGVADRNDDGVFAANGTRYEFVSDSGNETVEIDADDAVDVYIRNFEPEVGALEVADNEPDADLTLSLFLADGSEQEFYFRQQP